MTDTVKGSSSEAPYTSHAIKVSGIDGAKLRANKAEIERLEADCAYVEAAIALAPNSQIKLILELHVYDGLSWAEVSSRLTQYGIAKAEASCKQAAHRYYDQLEKEHEKVKRKAR